MVDLHAVDIRSLYADDNGVLKMGTPNGFYTVNMLNGRVEDVSSGNEENYSHILKRQYGIHKATKAISKKIFQRIISSAVNKSGHRCRYAVVQYILRDGREEDIIVSPHGNARHSKRPFYKTNPDVIESIKEEPLATKPKRFFKSLMDSAGGALHSKSASSEPRNIQQIYNIRKSQSAASGHDDFTRLISQIKENSFVHGLTIDSTAIQYTLATEKQLYDMERFCTNPLRFSVFSIDSTFNIGNYYVTNTCYEHLQIVHADGKYRGKHPLEMGPTFIHTDRHAHNYVSFFSSLLRMNPNLKTVQAIGHDGDEALMNASFISFPDALKLLCSTH